MYKQSASPRVYKSDINLLRGLYILHIIYTVYTVYIYIYCFLFLSHDGELVISGSEDHYVYMWRAQHRIASARKDRNDFYEGFSGEIDFIINRNEEDRQ